MKKLLAFTVLYMFMASGAHASTFKAGFFDLSEVLTRCEAYKSSIARIQKNFEREGNILKKQEQELQRRYIHFKDNASNLSPEERSTLNLELMYASRAFEDKHIAFKRRLGAAEGQARSEAHRIISMAVEALGVRENFTVILDASAAGAMYIDKSANVTPKVLKEANRIWREKPRALTAKER